MRGISFIGRITPTIMGQPTGKVHKAAGGVDCFEHHIPVYTSGAVRPPGAARHLLRLGALALVLSALLMVCVSVAALFFWKVTDRNVYNVRYSMSFNGEPGDSSSVEIDSDNNLQRFKPGDDALEIHDFHSGITGIRFFGGDKCYIKSQIKAHQPDMETGNKEPQTPDPRDEILPVRSEEEFMTWVAMEQPLQDTKFLSKKIISLCKDLPIHWLQPVYPKDGGRRKRDAGRARRQFSMHGSESTAAEEGDSEEKAPRPGAEEEDNGPQSAGSAFNPENPYHQARNEGAGEEAAVTFDPMLDHRGICCAECQRGYTHCQRICEPLGGHWPWPYHYRGCQVACRVIMPCRWWVARILGLV